MKQLSPSWAALSLLAPLALTIALAIWPLGCGGGGGSGAAASPTPTMGVAQIGFVFNPSTSSATGIQRILLNVISVRINHFGGPNILDTDPNWHSIPAPGGVAGLGELQIDLNPLQNQAQLFNTKMVPAQSYALAEILLDPNNPGAIVPDCPQASTANEGCLAYRFALRNPLTPLRVKIAAQVSHNGLTTLVINFDPGQILPPNAPGGFYVIDPVPTAQKANTLLGGIQGTVMGLPPNTSATVKAELSGTDRGIASAQVMAGGEYNLQLPAAVPSGTLYDLVVVGNGVSFSALSQVNVTRGQSVIRNFTVAKASTGSVTGRIIDARSLLPIQGATVSILIPALNDPHACQKATPSLCVVAVTATTDEAGHYPLPGSILSTNFFSIVPIGVYKLQVIAAGHDPVVATLPVNAGATAKCGTSLNPNACSFALPTVLISGSVSIDTPPPQGANVQVLVAAEDSGTNNLENLTAVTIPSGATTQTYTLNVPSTVTSFDMFASAQDFFDGAPSPFPGHTIAVLSGISGGATNADFPALDCVGHGSISGGVSVTPDSGTTVRLSKQSQGGQNVQLMESLVTPAGGPSKPQFSFCAPPDTYTLQRYENGTPAGTPTTVTMATPVPMASPCPSICSQPDGKCPSLCNNTAVINPL